MRAIDPPKPKKVVVRKPKLSPGDVFRFPLRKGWGFGRVLTESERAFYSCRATTKDVPLEEVVSNEVAFVQGCSDDGFYKKRWRVLGNLPLGPELTRPTYLFHQAVGATTCEVFDIWSPAVSREVPETECEDIEQWGAWSDVHVVERLETVLAGGKWVDAGRAARQRRGAS